MISENTKITLTFGQLRRLVMEGVAAGVAKDAALDAADAAIFGGAPVLKATEKGAEAYLKNDATVADDTEEVSSLPEIPQISDNEFQAYQKFLKGHGVAGELLKDPREVQILRKMLALGDNVNYSSNGGNFQLNGNTMAACLGTPDGKALKVLRDAIKSGKNDEDAIMAFLTSRVSNVGKGSLADQTYSTAIEKLKTGNFARSVAQNVKQAATTTATTQATQQAAQATKKAAQKAVSTVGKVMGAQGSSGIQQIAPQSGAFGGESLDTIDLNFE